MKENRTFEKEQDKVLKIWEERKQFLEEYSKVREYDFQNPEDIKRFKSYVDERVKFYADNYATLGDDFRHLKLYDRDGKCLERRIDAIMHYAPRVEKYKKEYPLVNPAEVLTEINFASGTNTFDNIFGESDHVTLAAAIWVLDELRLLDKMEEAYPYLDFGVDFCDAVELPKMCIPLYDERLLKSMVALIRNRNCDENGFKMTGGLVDDAAASRYYDPNNNTKDETECSIGKMSMRQRYDAVMALISGARRRQTRSSFETRVWGIFRNVLWAASYYQSQLNSKATEIIAIIDENRENQRKMCELNKRISDREKAISMSIKPPARNPGGALSFEEVEAQEEDYRLMNSYIKECEAFNEVHEMHSKELAKIEYKTMYLYVYTVLLAEGMVLDKDLYDQKVTDKLAVRPVVDPYETCFAYLYLLDSGSNLPWLYNLALLLVQKAVSQLPWVYSLRERTEFTDLQFLPLPSKIDDEPYKEMYYTTSSVEFVRGIMSTKSGRILNLPQIIYLLTDVVVPRRMFYEASKLDFYYGMNKGTVGTQFLKRYTELANAVSHCYVLPQKEKVDNSKELQEEIQKYAEKNRELRADLEKTFELLNESRREASALKKKLCASEEKLMTNENEIKRLQDEITMFRSRSIEQPKAPEIAFPYNLRYRTVILGGSEQWANMMRDYLHGCKTFHVDKKADANVVRECDVIWIYSKEVTHSQFKKIINLARKYNIPVKYFSYKGAEKCAEQVALSDMEGNIE